MLLCAGGYYTGFTMDKLHESGERRVNRQLHIYSVKICVLSDSSPIKNSQETIKGTERPSPYTPYSIGNSSRVIFRIGISYLARGVDVSWRFRMTKRRAKHVGREAMKA